MVEKKYELTREAVGIEENVGAMDLLDCYMRGDFVESTERFTSQRTPEYLLGWKRRIEFAELMAEAVNEELSKYGGVNYKLAVATYNGALLFRSLKEYLEHQVAGKLVQSGEGILYALKGQRGLLEKRYQREK